jgi:hypothetical protein
MPRCLLPAFPILLVLSAVLFALGACAVDSESKSLQPARQIQVPTNARTLLLNLRTGMQRGVFISPEFYTDDTLTRFFGATPINWVRRTETSLTVRMRGIDYLPAREEGTSRIGILRSKVDERGQLSAAGKLIAAFSLVCACELRVADIEAVFGTEGVITDERERLRAIQGHMSLPPPARDPMGHKRLSYEIPAERAAESTLSVIFDIDGRVRTIEAKQREA